MGLPSYFNGIPCFKGHVAPKRTRDNSCRECMRHTPSRQRRNRRRELEMMLETARRKDDTT
jgi:hypothetical protein